MHEMGTQSMGLGEKAWACFSSVIRWMHRHNTRGSSMLDCIEWRDSERRYSAALHAARCTPHAPIALQSECMQPSACSHFWVSHQIVIRVCRGGPPFFGGLLDLCLPHDPLIAIHSVESAEKGQRDLAGSQLDSISN